MSAKKKSLTVEEIVGVEPWEDFLESLKKMMLTLPNYDEEVANIISEHFLVKNPDKDAGHNAVEAYNKLVDKRLSDWRKKRAYATS